VVLERAVVELLRDIGERLLGRDEDVARLVVEAPGRVGVPDVLDRNTGHLLVSELRFGVGIAKYHDNARLPGRLARDFDERTEDPARGRYRHWHSNCVKP
jgi:hypothetical protein